jgi:hypothetical protein
MQMPHILQIQSQGNEIPELSLIDDCHLQECIYVNQNSKRNPTVINDFEERLEQSRVENTNLSDAFNSEIFSADAWNRF